MPKTASNRPTHADLVALSRFKGRVQERLADEAQKRGNDAAATEHRRIAKLYADEAVFQEREGAG